MFSSAFLSGAFHLTGERSQAAGAGGGGGWRGAKGRTRPDSASSPLLEEVVAEPSLAPSVPLLAGATGVAVRSASSSVVPLVAAAGDSPTQHTTDVVRSLAVAGGASAGPVGEAVAVGPGEGGRNAAGKQPLPRLSGRAAAGAGCSGG
jgi:hypothetical protein